MFPVSTKVRFELTNRCKEICTKLTLKLRKDLASVGNNSKFENQINNRPTDWLSASV